MKWVAIIGADGAGKSTVIEGVEAHLEAKGLDYNYHHWCPRFSKSLKPYSGDASDPHKLAPRGKFTSYLKLLKLFLHWWEFKLRGVLGKTAPIVIVDRFYGDLLVDPIRYRYGGSLGLARFVFKFFPKPEKVILLHASAETLYQRKQEVEMKILTQTVRKYSDYIKAVDGVLIDAERPVDEVIASMCRELDFIHHSKF